MTCVCVICVYYLLTGLVITNTSKFILPKSQLFFHTHQIFVLVTVFLLFFFHKYKLDADRKFSSPPISYLKMTQEACFKLTRTSGWRLFSDCWMLPKSSSITAGLLGTRPWCHAGPYRSLFQTSQSSVITAMKSF